MFLFLVHMPKAIYITGNLLYCIQQLKTLQISTLRGKAKNYSENILLCEYTCKTCGKNIFFNDNLAIIQKLPPLLNLNPKFQVLHGILNHAIFSQIFQGYLRKEVHSGSKSSLFDRYLRILFGITMLCT